MFPASDPFAQMSRQSLESVKLRLLNMIAECEKESAEHRENLAHVESLLASEVIPFPVSQEPEVSARRRKILL